VVEGQEKGLSTIPEVLAYLGAGIPKMARESPVREMQAGTTEECP
jgi:hypothetical protein